MTAAALRPDLFTHLFATQREAPQKGDAAATALSVMFHLGIIGALIWASTQLRPQESIVVSEPPIPIFFPEAVQARTDGGGGGGGSERPIQVPTLSLPDPIAGIPDPIVGPQPWYEPGPTPGPPVARAPGVSGPGERVKDGFLISTTVPELLNSAQVTQALVRSYPAFLRDAGIGGEVMVWLLIDETGRVIDTEIKSGSGQAALDQVALNVAELMRFLPARNRDQQVKVWVSVPIRFVTQGR